MQLWQAAVTALNAQNTSCRSAIDSRAAAAVGACPMCPAGKRSALRQEHSRRSVGACSVRAVAAAAATATEEQAPVAERLSGEDAQRWAAALDEVKGLGYDDKTEAEALLERAFGWRTQAFWRGTKKEEVPAPESVAATLNYLRELGLKDEDIRAAFKKFPEGLASDVEERLKPNIEALQKEHYIAPKVLLPTIKRQPKVLGFSYDCQGSCEGECHRCWVRF